MRRRSFNPLFWTLAQVGSRVRSGPPVGVEDPAVDLPELRTVGVDTRHGLVEVHVQLPAPGRGPSAGAPVILHLHGGGFVNRNPRQDVHIARHLAGQLGAVVVLPDYSTAPTARYPQAEEDVLDLVHWIRSVGDEQGWNAQQLVVSGVSAGAKLALNVCQQLYAAGEPRPTALVLTVPVTDVVRTDRTSQIRRPAINPLVQRFVNWAYFPDTERRREPLASPRLDPMLAAMSPPTLVLTAAHDTLAAEGAELVEALRAGGVEVVHHQYPGVDHGFIAEKPVEVVRDALNRMSSFIAAHLGIAQE